MKDLLRIIGDAHGKFDKYIPIAKGADYSIQIGDMGFAYDKLNELNAKRHKFFGGNHENYDIINKCPYNLGDYGIVEAAGLNFFYCRGAYSIDKVGRIYSEWETGRKCWWPQEELSYGDGMRALIEYEKLRPRFVLTHDCPLEVSRLIGNPDILRNFGFDPDTFKTSTGQLLQAMFEIHEPEVWIFGHYHFDKITQVRDTKFITLRELGHVAFNERYEVFQNNIQIA